MPTLPDGANLDHLKKQAKDLLRLHRAGNTEAIARVTRTLPFATGDLRLHDTQSCVAREYGFLSWADLSAYVQTQTDAEGDRIRQFLALAYAGDIIGTYNQAHPRLAAQLLNDEPALATNPSIACATGDEAFLRRALSASTWVNRPDGPFHLPPLVAAAHSSLVQLPEFRDRLHHAAQLLLDAGADPNQSIANRFPPASVTFSDETHRLSALYGAAGVNHDPALTELLLQSGADPNDNESLYHSLENPECTRILLRHGARIAGTNALRRAFDMSDPTALELLLAHGADPNEPAGPGPTNAWGAPILRAIAVRRSVRHIRALLTAGADPNARTPSGTSAYSLALQTGAPEIADLLKTAGADTSLSDEEEFVAACARADIETARRIQARRPDLPASLPVAQLRLLPDTVAWGSAAAARTMIELGWPLAARGGDWGASALNHAVFRGDAALTALLLDHGTSWQETHGYGSDVLGTLSWASVYPPVENGDWPGCARALIAHGLPVGQPDPEACGRLLIAGRPSRFSDEVTAVLLGTA